MDREFETYLDCVTINGEPKWYTDPPFDIIREVASADDDILLTVFKKLNFKLVEEESSALIALIRDFANDHDTKAFDRLPKALQSRIKNLHEKMSKNSKEPIAIEVLAHMMLAQLIQNISMDAMMAKIEREQTAMAKEQYEKSDAIFNDIFTQQDELEAETPGVGKNIEAVKKAFAAASNFNHQLAYLKNDIPHTIKRYHQHYNGETQRFNIRCAESNFALIGIKDYMPNLIKANLPTSGHYTTDEIKAFIVLFIRSLDSIDLNELYGAAYTHRLLDCIYRTKFTPNTASSIVFDNIAKVIDEYRKIIEAAKKKKGR